MSLLNFSIHSKFNWTGVKVISRCPALGFQRKSFTIFCLTWDCHQGILNLSCVLDLIDVSTRLKSNTNYNENWNVFGHYCLTSSWPYFKTTVFSLSNGFAVVTKVPSDMYKSTSLTDLSGVKSTETSTSRPRVWSMVNALLRSWSEGLTLAFWTIYKKIVYWLNLLRPHSKNDSTIILASVELTAGW